jgi:hypothetical protein
MPGGGRTTYDRPEYDAWVRRRAPSMGVNSIGLYQAFCAEFGIAPSVDSFFSYARRILNSATVSELSAPPGQGYQPPHRHPPGWEPGFVIQEGKGEINSGPLPEGKKPDWSFVMRELRVDPELFEVVEPVNVRTWDAALGNGEVKRFFYYKANIVARRSVEDKLDVELLRKTLEHYRPRKKPPPPAPGESVFMVFDSDWQLGKRDGDGTQGVIGRVIASTDRILERVAELRQIGRQIGELRLVGMGDLVEGCDGHYAMQTFAVELDRRQQRKVARRLLRHRLATLAPHFAAVGVRCVPGNHGENRKEGKLFTSWGDNDDVAVFEDLAEIFQEQEAFRHVNFWIPDQELDLTEDVAGIRITYAHGHQAKRGGSVDQKVENWWKGQSHGMLPAIDSEILVTAHYHHLHIKQEGPRAWFGCPPLESESTWVKNTLGKVAHPGVLSFVLGPTGWSDVAIL